MSSDPLLTADRDNALLTTTLRKTLLADLAARYPHVADFDPPETEDDFPSDAVIRRHRMRVKSRLEDTMYDFFAVSRAIYWVQGEFADLDEDDQLRNAVAAAFAVIFAAVDDTEDFAQILQEGLELYAKEIGEQGMDSYVTVEDLRVEFLAHPLDEIHDRIDADEPVPPSLAYVLYSRAELTYSEYLDELETAFEADPDMLEEREIALLLDESRISEADLNEE